MGGSFLKSLQKFKINIYAIEPDIATQSKAKKENENLEFITLEDQDILKDIDLVISTLYPTKVIDLMKTLNNKLSDDCLFVEISGLKKEIAESLTDIDLNFQYLLVHPMAGRENGGYDYSCATIYEDANHIIIDDVKQCNDNLFKQYLLFIDALGFKKPSLMSVVEHDQAITYTSQLTHIMCVALLNSSDYQACTKHAIGDSFRDLTRIANMNVDLWSTLFSNNQDNLTSSIDNFIEQLEVMKESLNKPEQLVNELEKAKRKRTTL